MPKAIELTIEIIQNHSSETILWQSCYPVTCYPVTNGKFLCVLSFEHIKQCVLFIDLIWSTDVVLWRLLCRGIDYTKLQTLTHSSSYVMWVEYPIQWTHEFSLEVFIQWLNDNQQSRTYNYCNLGSLSKYIQTTSTVKYYKLLQKGDYILKMYQKWVALVTKLIWFISAYDISHLWHMKV